MAKRSSKVKEQPVEPAWYTATLTPIGFTNDNGILRDAKGRQVGRPVKHEFAKDKVEVEAKLRAKGYSWEDITIVKGRDPGLTRKGGTEHYYAELQAMLGIGSLALHAWSDVEPRPMWASPDIMPDPDATARTGWEKFMNESSYGLSVSAFPRFIIPDVDGYPTLPLPAADVRNAKRWDATTSIVRDQLDYWKGTLQERIERLGKAKRRSAEDTDELKRDKATLKQLQAFDGWSYHAFVEAMLPGRQPDPRDLDNLRLYRLSNGHLVPITNLGPDQLRVDFWRRLLSLWEGPVDNRATTVRDFLDHHHRYGGKDEVFRDLVKDTAARLRGLVSKGASLRNSERWGLLADKLEQWLPDALNSYGEWWSRPSLYVFVRNRATNAEEWISENHIDFVAYHHGLPIPIATTVDGWREFVKRYEAIATSPFALSPFAVELDETVSSLDLENPFSLAENWRGTGLMALRCDTDPDPYSLRLSLMWKVREAIVNFWYDGLGMNPSIRVGKIKTYLDHHATHGADEAALLDALEIVFLMDNPPAPLDVRWCIEKGEIPETLPDGLKTEVREWIEERRKVVAKAKQPQKDAPKPLKDRFPKPEQYVRFIELLQEHEIVDVGGTFIHGHGRKSRLFGAYQGASENPALRFSTGSLSEIVATLNGAFSNLELSAAKPQDLHGTKGHTKMRKAFSEAVFPL